MTKQFLVTGTWVDKKTGTPKSGIAEISKGINKDGNAYSIAATDKREMPLDGSYPIGTIITANVNFVTDAGESKFSSISKKN